MANKGDCVLLKTVMIVIISVYSTFSTQGKALLADKTYAPLQQ